MKKIKFSILFTILMINSVFSQTNDFPSTGNVTIGSGHLIQSGDNNIQTQGAVKLKSYLLFDNDGDFTGGNYYTIQDHSSGNYLRLGYGWSDNLVINSLGNVGIGTTTPNSPLDIVKPDIIGEVWTPNLILRNARDNFSSEGLRIRSGHADLNFDIFSYDHSTTNDEYLGFRVGSGDLNSSFGSPQMVLAYNGFLGIGTTSPNQQLEVSGNIRLNTSTSRIEWNNNTLQLGNYVDAIPVIQLRGSNSYNPRIDIMNAGNTQTMIKLNGGGNSFFNGGNVLIGKTTQQNSNYKLDVAGSIRADEIKVNLDGADFVFEPDYKLRPLKEVESYIQENKRLPEIASANEMSNEGADLGKLNTKLLQKIEELTLYIIEQNKRIENLENKLEKIGIE